jgi:putative chitinase
MITIDKFKLIFPKADNTLYDAIVVTCKKYEIDTKERIASFISQVAHESANFTTTIENLNYGKDGLLSTFPKYFNASNVDAFARKPELIASRVYALRMGNGNEASKEGWKYRGRGYLQVTGKDNYLALGKTLGIDLISNPDALLSYPYSIVSAGWFWWTNKINLIADTGSVANVTKRINGGLNGLSDRERLYSLVFGYM